MRGSMLVWIEEIIRREDGSIREVRVNMDGFKALMSPEDIIEMERENPGRVPNIFELVPPEDTCEDEGIVVTEDEGGHSVDLVVHLGSFPTREEAVDKAHKSQSYSDEIITVVKSGNGLSVKLSRTLRRMGVGAGDRVRVIVLKD